ncbi:MAG: alpha/beta fold hydrolase [Sulfuritalea sp.]|nr:alpha/beta fold hydrolase [Sulfuritalea sp.]
MVARQMRLLLSGELLLYGVLSAWLVAQRGWTAPEALSLALASFLGLRLFVVAVTFGFMLTDSDSVAPEFRIGPARAVRMVLEEYVGLILLFTAIQPFEAFWLGPDRLAQSSGRRLPLLLIHGYQCNRGLWFWLRPRLEAAGWTVATVSLEPAWADIDSYAKAIDRRIDEVLAATGAPRVMLVCHSMGGPVSRAYLRRHGSDKVARIVTLGSPHQGTGLAVLGPGRNARQLRIGNPWLVALAAPGAVPLPPASVSIFSYHDNYVFPQQACSTLADARHVAIGGVSHLGMAFSPLVLGKLLEALEAT